MGITIGKSEDGYVTYKYVTYKLPKGWRTVDNSRREDIPCFHILDCDNLIRVTICGMWKGSYDNKLDLYVGSGLREYISPTSNVIEASGSNNPNIVGTTMEIFDPLGRPADKIIKTSRKEDYQEDTY